MALTPVTDFALGTHSGTRPAPHGPGLALAPGAESGEWLSPVYPARRPITWAVASWNGDGRLIEIQVRVATSGGWSPWFTFGPWSAANPELRHSVDGQTVPDVGRLSTDTLLLEHPARSWQLKVRLEQAHLKRLWLATHGPAEGQTPDVSHAQARGVDLPVPLRSQMVYPNGGRVWCSPTSLAMVMAYWDVVESIPDQVVPGVYDPVYQGHGNWPFNTAYAAARGFVAYVDRFSTFAELERWIAAGVPVIASVAYKREWLPNAPIDQTAGHLLVVRGFTETGDVIVNDPAAARDDDVRLVYDRELFRRAWLARGGVVYVIYPERKQPEQESLA